MFTIREYAQYNVDHNIIRETEDTYYIHNYKIVFLTSTELSAVKASPKIIVISEKIVIWLEKQDNSDLMYSIY